MKNESEKINGEIKFILNQSYRYGFETVIEKEQILRGLNITILELLNSKKSEPRFVLNFRLKSYKAWLNMQEPSWSDLIYKRVDYNDIVSNDGSACPVKIKCKNSTPS
jgi:Fe-S cluster assembly protein SufB